MKSIQLNQKVVEIAKSYNGQTEIGNNGGWKDKLFEASMRAIGWMKGWAWCSSFVRLCYLKAAAEVYGKYSIEYAILKRTIKHGVLATYRAAKQDPHFTITKEPIFGGIIIFDYGQGKGHTGIYLDVDTDRTVKLIEGNTNKEGSREGKYVMERTRVLQNNPKYLGCITFVG